MNEQAPAQANASPLPTNTFENILRHHRKGTMASELSEKLQQLTAACMATSKGGKLVLTIKVSPASGDGTAMSLSDEIEIKVPTPAKPNSIFYTSQEGVLLRENPEQHQLDLKVVPSVREGEALKTLVAHAANA